jgi:glycerophosphoryl diester phosphodiesterase
VPVQRARDAGRASCEREAAMTFFDGARPRLFGHRGAAAVAPENTLPSLTRALSDGARYVEFDVHATADGHIVVIHDPTVDRTTEGTGAVRDLMLSAVRRLDAGYRFTDGHGAFPFRGCDVRIPTLDEVLDQFPSTPATIELKPVEPSIVDRVVDIVLAHGAGERVVLATGEDVIMPRLRIACARHRIPTNFAPSEVAEFIRRVGDGTLAGYRPPGAALQIPPEWQGVPLITDATVAAAHSLGVEIHAWTINDESEMERLLRLGVDGIMTDIPALGHRVMARHAGAAW